MANIETGQQAPALKGSAYWRTRAEGEKFIFDLEDFRGQKVVLAFYPGDFTPVCTKEMCDFADNISVLKELNALVVGISIDDIESHEKFARKYNLEFPLVDDSNKKIGEAYDVVGPLFGARHRRAIFIVNEEGKIAFKKIEATALFRTEAKEIARVLETI